MPPRKRNDERERQFGQTVRVRKRDVDPFGAREQAERLARRHAPTGRGPNTRDLEFETTDEGDHYAVRITGRGDSAGPGYRGPPEHAEAPEHAGPPGLAASGGPQAEEFLAIGAGSRPGPGSREHDVAGRLAQRASKAELMRLGKRYGVRLGRGNRDELARQFTDQAPEAARDLVFR